MSNLVSTIPDCAAAALAEERAEELAREMEARWRAGEQVAAEALLSGAALVAGHAPAAVRVIYEEICLRQDAGLEISPDALLARFPKWREELQALLACHQLLVPERVTFPAPGESLGGFRLLCELGRGVHSRVFLATQALLAGRLVVLKVSPREGDEHLLLSSLQHTHIVPLYSVQDDARRPLRACCMPYLGGTTLDRVLAEISVLPRGERNGGSMVRILDDSRSPHWGEQVGGSPARRLLERSSYTEAVAWIGACLADALAHVHERGLVHFDLKPSNVLLAADGQPMLLDFHLAREPVRQGETLPGRFGGTLRYMSPEQAEAMMAARDQTPVATKVDGRSDIYSLGVLLQEALGHAPETSAGLSAIITRCCSRSIEGRYADASSLAEDLRRHLKDLPLRGVRTPLGERWRKWRRRRPSALPLVAMLAIAFVAAASALAIGGIYLGQERARAEQALADGRLWLAEERFDDAARALEQGLEAASHLPLETELPAELRAKLANVQHSRQARQLHSLVDRLRVLYGVEAATQSELNELAALCRVLWQRREQLAHHRESSREDRLEFAVLWADLRGRLADENAHREAVEILRQAEQQAGSSPVLEFERRRHAAETATAEDLTPRTSWEHWALGRALLSAGRVREARERFNVALELTPDALWPRFYLAHAAHRLRRFDEALAAAEVCVALAPRRAECLNLRGTARAALTQWEPARRDFTRALELDPEFGLAALNRAIANQELGRLAEALADLEYAIAHGVSREAAKPHAALVEAKLRER